MTGDPYEEAAQQQRLDDARLVPPGAAPRNRKILVVGLVLVGTILALVIVANITGLVKLGPEPKGTPKPVTMSREQSDNFASQQSGQANYMKGMDRDKNRQSAEDTVLGQANGLASDANDEADGVPKKTKAQDDAEHGRGSGTKSEAELRHERLVLEAEHRQQNDLDSSPLALDFSDYFDKEKQSPAPGTTTNVNAAATQTSRRSSPFPDLLRKDDGQPQLEPASTRKEAHDPKEDYTFDSSFGKLYRLMEDTVIETVLVNRLTGAAVGPVITMVTTDLYSESGSHLLIPKGTRLLGRVSAVGSLNQERLFVAFHRMIMPDGYSVSLDKFQGLDVVGQTGLRDLVNHHYLQIFGTSIALSAIAATAQIGNNASYGTYDWGVQMRNSVSEGLGQSAQRVMERFINGLPTFTVRERARVKVMLSGDLLLPDTKNHTMDPDL